MAASPDHRPPVRRSAAARARRRKVIRRRRITVATLLLVVVGAVTAAVGIPGGGARHGRGGRTSAGRPAATSGAQPWSLQSWLAGLEARVKGQPGHLVAGSDPAALPGPILIADRNANRLLLV
ncbi:MAG: hypothetical protein ACYDEN_06950, partial [Acidimicrobiales bacterium]